jgi:hypothetical protein
MGSGTANEFQTQPARQGHSREKAYEILQDMTGKLEKPLVDAFREVALSR